MSEKIDKLNRGDFIKFIENLILNSEQYKRNNDSDSYVIAFDSAWGTGKSYFIELLMQDIKSSCDNMRVIKYNAWENDYCDNAFNPLMYEILKSEHLQFGIESDSDRENLNKIMKSVCRVGEAFGKQIINGAVKKATGIDFAEVIQKAVETKEDIKNFMLREIPNINELNTERETFKNFKEYISNATQWMKDGGIKLVVIIDELDRCKPLFAIQTLEVVKHLFDVENIVFLFAVDIEQLSHSISSIYGQGFNSVGYLCRFFDYIAKMPNADIKIYIDAKMKQLKTIPDVLVNLKKQNEIKLVDVLSDFMFDIYKSFDFSLRDLDTVLQSYNIMLNNFLKEYHMFGAHMIYLFYLSLKYKQPHIFHELFVEKSSDARLISDRISSFKEWLNNVWVDSSIDVMEKDLELQEIRFQGFFDDNSDLEKALGRYYKSFQNGQMLFVDNNPSELSPRQKNIQERLSLDNILFYPDMIKWNNIKHMTYREYLHKQLEMYNFVDVEKE